MKLSAVLLARVIYFVESVDLNPVGAAYYPEIVAALVNRYGFIGFPKSAEDFDEQKGVTFLSGRLRDATIVRVVIHNWGITLDSTSSTRDSDNLLHEALTWATENLRLTYSPGMVRRKGFVSQVTFYSDAPFLSLNPVLTTVGERLSKEVAANLNLPYIFGPRGMSMGVDPETLRIPIQAFTIERREGVAYSEGKYFSAAPVSTESHIEILSQLERAARASKF